MKTKLLAFAVLAALATPASADVILGGATWTSTGTTLTLAPVVPGGNQPLNIQCVICGDNQPQQSSTFGYTNFHNSGQPGQDLRYFSTNVSGGGDPGLDVVGLGYDGSFLRAFLLAGGNLPTFSIGIDVNDTNNPQVLESFALLNLTTHTVLAQYSLFEVGGTALVNANNGTGFPDWTLSGFDITLGQDIHVGDQLIFYARLSNANDGPDSFFLVPQAVPGPIVGAGIPGLVMAGMMLLGLARRRRAPAV